MKGRTLRRVGLAALTLLVLAEVAVRGVGLVDFPTYAVDDDIGYFPHPDQAGAFLRKNRWVFNDRSMGIETPWRPSDRTDVLLVGNSVVLGGNNYDQKDKIAPRMQGQVGARCAIWPVATGGWGTVNEYRFLERHPDIVEGADFFVWEIMAHQMEGPQRWTRETSVPTQRPWWATAYVVKKALHDRFPQWTLPAREHTPASVTEIEGYYQRFESMLDRLAAVSGRSPAGIVFLYPDRQQLRGARQGLEWLKDRDRIERLTRSRGLVLIDISRYPAWVDSMYRDQVHPTAAGNAVLADILAQALRRVLPPC